MDVVSSVLLSQQDQAAVNQTGGVFAQKDGCDDAPSADATVTQIPESMQGDPDYPNSFGGF